MQYTKLLSLIVVETPKCATMEIAIHQNIYEIKINPEGFVGFGVYNYYLLRRCLEVRHYSTISFLVTEPPLMLIFAKYTPLCNLLKSRVCCVAVSK